MMGGMSREGYSCRKEKEQQRTRFRTSRQEKRGQPSVRHAGPTGERKNIGSRADKKEGWPHPGVRKMRKKKIRVGRKEKGTMERSPTRKSIQKKEIERKKGEAGPGPRGGSGRKGGKGGKAWNCAIEGERVPESCQRAKKGFGEKGNLALGGGPTGGGKSTFDVRNRGPVRSRKERKKGTF